ncbi:hypothetical protein [Chitinophaga sp. 22620]|uniref:hypothetical protein n=1 Tax=Chitinophaga sp. 22620 TaxID=3453952 RepID=UPI003F847DAF
MRNLKLSFALVIAILAVGFTVATKASTFGAKVIPDCFVLDIDVINSAGTVTNELIQNEARASILTDLAASPYLNEDISATAVEQTTVCPATARFCCAKFTLLDPSTPGVPVKTVNGVSGKWSVQAFYRN